MEHIDINKRKKILETALVKSFVDDYNAYKNTVDFINMDFEKSDVKFQYSYDAFCVDFLNLSLENIDIIDVLESETDFNSFYKNFLKFNLYVLKGMLKNKLNELGYDAGKFYSETSDTTNNSKKYLN